MPEKKAGLKMSSVSVTTIAKANNYYLAVENTDGASRDLILKTLFLNLVSFNQHFTETLEILNAYLNSKRDSKHDFAAKEVSLRRALAQAYECVGMCPVALIFRHSLVSTLKTWTMSRGRGVGCCCPPHM